jgi:hypothetical protein
LGFSTQSTQSGAQSTLRSGFAAVAVNMGSILLRALCAPLCVLCVDGGVCPDNGVASRKCGAADPRHLGKPAHGENRRDKVGHGTRVNRSAGRCFNACEAPHQASKGLPRYRNGHGQ